HMMMAQPVPYGKDTLNNSPLAADGSDFPCKLRSNTYQVTEENTAAIGQSMPLSFIGSAVHGGGSCQVSLTTDREPTKDSKWIVIKSIEGGCPANVDGNLSGGPTSTGASKFTYTIPEGIEPGKYTLAWTWFNRIGNREMYMNCAPLTVTGSSSKRDEVPKEKTVEKRSANFPPMFVANVNGCTTKEGVDIRFPNPGSIVEYAGDKSNLAAEGSQAC
nr:Chain A, AA11 Lytic Polysaccharide Monooxygenase [Aspergillus oryzae]4MAI_A Chain A, AA11 Lytic Polysaccharide Monooxygenase [Aspergillus oryzae]